MLKVIGVERLALIISVTLALGVFVLFGIRSDPPLPPQPGSVTSLRASECSGDLAHQLVRREGNRVLDSIEPGLDRLKDQEDVYHHFRSFLAAGLLVPTPPSDAQISRELKDQLYEAVSGASIEAAMNCFPRLKTLAEKANIASSPARSSRIDADRKR